MPSVHGPRRAQHAQIAFSDSAAKQLDAITNEAELHALDRALVVISVDPDAGELLPADSSVDVHVLPDRRHRRPCRGDLLLRQSFCLLSHLFAVLLARWLASHRHGRSPPCRPHSSVRAYRNHDGF
ncbi:hypothetical protein E4K73_48205 [Streptomyces sp. IB201691-2A2]|nr:hypothetical protein E4K73_48205 [Streptomyces sp. IB201691-2A2]